MRILFILFFALVNWISKLGGGGATFTTRIQPSGAFNVWMDEKGLRRSTVTFEYYDEEALQREPGGCVIVGAGARGNTQIGFAVEFDRYDRVIDSQLFQAEHEYGWYRRFAAEARQTRQLLMNTIGDRARKLYD